MNEPHQLATCRAPTSQARSCGCDGARPARRPADGAELRRLVELLRTCKDRSGLSLAELSARTAFSKSAWHRYLSGVNFPPRSAVEAMARISGADPQLLLAAWTVAQHTWHAGPDPRIPADVDTPSSSPVLPATAEPQSPTGSRGRLPRRSRALVLGVGLAATAVLAYWTVRVAAADPAADRPPLTALAAAARGRGEPPALSHSDAITPAGPDPQSGPAGGVGCSGRGCQGADPYSAGCDRNARTLTSAYLMTVTVRLRFSPACHAAWALAVGTPSGGLRALYVRGADGAVLAMVPSVPLRDHSPMLVVHDARSAAACAEFVDVQLCADPGSVDPARDTGRASAKE